MDLLPYTIGHQHVTALNIPDRLNAGFRGGEISERLHCLSGPIDARYVLIATAMWSMQVLGRKVMVLSATHMKYTRILVHPEVNRIVTRLLLSIQCMRIADARTVPEPTDDEVLDVWVSLSVVTWLSLGVVADQRHDHDGRQSKDTNMRLWIQVI